LEIKKSGVFTPFLSTSHSHFWCIYFRYQRFCWSM